MKCERWNPIADLAAPLRWRNPRRVELSLDLFGEDSSDEWIAALHGIMAATPQHTYQVLTKRPERAARWYGWIESRASVDGERSAFDWCFRAACRSLGRAAMIGPPPAWPLRNVWLGVSVEDQQRADERIPYLLRCRAAVRFLSAEPMIGPVDFNRCPAWNPADNPMYLDGIAWVIVGGESGPGSRPCHVEWIRSIVRQCRAALVPVFVKQLGARPVVQHPMVPGALIDAGCSDRKGGDPAEWPEDLRVREWPEVKL